jgi:hypothetical protein
MARTEINSGDSNSSTQTTILNNLRPEQGITKPIQTPHQHHQQV